MRKYMLLGLMCTILSCGNALAADSIRFDFTPSFVAQSLEKQKAKQITLTCERCAAPQN